jgi:hypothetical protein
MKPGLVVGGLILLAFGVSAFTFAKEKTAPALLQLLGAASLMVVVLTHVAETFHLFPWMGWGLPNSAGHYIDLISALGGLILFTTGYLSRRFANRRILK